MLIESSGATGCEVNPQPAAYGYGRAAKPGSPFRRRLVGGAALNDRDRLFLLADKPEGSGDGRADT